MDCTLTFDISNIAQRWRMLCGHNHWEGLLTPLDTDLQKCVLHCGAMCEACYDGFNSNPLSRYTGCCRYPIRNFLSRAGLVLGNPFKYKVVKYIYAASVLGLPPCFFSKSTVEGALFQDSNWMGFVAVSTDEGKRVLGRRDIMVAWRGTMRPAEWGKDFDGVLVSAHEIVGRVSSNAQIHHGFLTIYTSSIQGSRHNQTSARQQVLSEIRKQMEIHRDEEMSITVTGHSLGAAVAIVNGVDIAANGHNLRTSCRVNKVCPVTVINFGGPRVGDHNFKLAVESIHDLRVLRVVNFPDMVPRVPPAPPLGFYHHVGEKLEVNCLLSPYLKMPVDIASWHTPEPGYLHPLAIANGATNLRPLACVNKFSACLKPEFMCPPFWWMERNMCMVQTSSGSWVLNDYGSDDESTVDSEID